MRLELPEGTTVGGLVDTLVRRYPGLKAHRSSLLVAVDREFRDEGTGLRGGEEVALMPPVSGGLDRVRIQEEPLDPGAVLDSIRRGDCGALALFVGSVRADPGVGVLEYEAYDEMALEKLEQVRLEALDRFGIKELAIHHRKGKLRVGEDSVIVAVAAGHREEAFGACRWAMEQVKLIVPIWKVRKHP